jgi:hypothetical protein
VIFETIGELLSAQILLGPELEPKSNIAKCQLNALLLHTVAETEDT